jgi:anti-anti-sigma factor
MDAFENGARHLVADLDKTEYLSSAGISAMFYAQKKVSVLGAGASFDIVNVSMGIKEIFDITGFSKFFSITVKDDVK